jgi:fused signal recognition particle receptor
MFKKLREKLSNWTKKISKETEENGEEPEVLEEEIEAPVKFEPGKQKFEPDLEKLEEIQKDLETEESQEKSFFKKITSKVNKIKISEKEFEVYSEELEMLLLENNVALKVSEKIIKELKERIIGRELLKKEIEFEIKEIFKEIIEEILIEPFDLSEKVKDKLQNQSKEPYVILFCGINGTGKTTTIAKVAKYLKKKNLSCVLAASDTFRAASIEQLKEHGKKLDIRVVSSQYGADPASVAFDAIRYAKKNFINCVLIDTAGRIHTSKNLMREIEKIKKNCNPDAKIFVGESITGNDVIEQAKSFDWAVGIDGIILTKADIDERGGTALSLGYVTKKPILFLGCGQEIDDIVPFNKKEFIKSLGLE